MDENVNASQGDETRVEVRRGLIGVVRAGDVHLQQGISALTTARRSADVRQAASIAVISGGDTSMKMAAAVAVPTLGDLRMEQAGAQWVISAGDVRIEKGGCAAAVAPSVHVDRGGVGIALGWRVEAGEGGRILFGPRAAAVFGVAAGVAAGLVVAARLLSAADKALKLVPRLRRRS